MQQVLKELFEVGIEAVNPYLAVKMALERHQDEIKSYKNVVVIGLGKAACAMGKAAQEVLEITDGLAVTKYKHAYPLDKIKVFEAGHPVPDENGVRATEMALKIVDKYAHAQTVFICLISGGGSALFIAPYDGLNLEEKQTITQLLLNSGANIYELNAVRKHLSKVKGGRLAERMYPARIISLILSDVIGDKLDVIASGPTAPDESTYQDAWNILERYQLVPQVPVSIKEVLIKGQRGIFPETLKPQSPVFKRVTNSIIGSNRSALQAIKQEAQNRGFKAQIISAELQGEAKEVGKRLARLALKTQAQLENNSLCLISGGETTVTVKGNGLGGRNMELGLAFAMEIAGKKGIWLLSAGSDGTDGPTDAAGAIVDGETTVKAKKMGIDPKVYLENNDSYNFFKKVGGLLITGPTGTNVMDIQIMIIKPIIE